MKESETLFDKLVNEPVPQQHLDYVTTAWPTMQQVTGTNVLYTTNVAPSTYASAASILNR